MLADETDYVGVRDWSHSLFINILTDKSSQAITIIFIKKDCIRITPFTFDATLLNYNEIFTDRT